MNTRPLFSHVRSAAYSALSVLILGQPSLRASDHGDAPAISNDEAADIADLYLFEDPTTPANVVLIGTVHGFIVPGEAVNFAIFDSNIRYHFDLFNDHVNSDPPTDLSTPADKAKFLARIKPTASIDVTFSERTGGPDAGGVAGKEALEIPSPQTATIQFTGFKGVDKAVKFTAPVLNPNLAAAPQNLGASVTNLGGTAGNVSFFAGETDDPFFFDIPAFSRFIASIRHPAMGQPSPDVSVLSRGRDSFAGYNVLSIAFSIPKTLIKNADSTKTKVAADFLTQRHIVQMPTKTGTIKGVGAYKTVDRIGNPAVNVVLLPFTQKNAYNVGTPKDDASLKFAGGILGTLGALGTTGTPFDPMTNVGLLAKIAVRSGDVLTLDLTQASGFPNGRKLSDDVVDTLLTVVAGGALGDNVNGNDVPFSVTFPYLAPPQQPRDPNADPVLNVDDNTRN